MASGLYTNWGLYWTSLYSNEFHPALYYNPKLGSGCNLGKDLSKNEGDDQLIKHKDTGLYL